MLGAADAAKPARRARPEPRPLRRLASPGFRPGAALEVGGVSTIGRDHDCTVRLDGDEFASARHARIDPRPDGVWVEDLGSTNGTFVNGARNLAAAPAAGRRPARRRDGAAARMRSAP